MNIKNFALCLFIGVIIGFFVGILLFDCIIRILGMDKKINFIYNTLQDNNIEWQQ